MMFKALLKKKLREFQATQWNLAVWFLAGRVVASSFALWFDTVEATFCRLPCWCFSRGGWGQGAPLGFPGDFANQANLFIEYLPVKRAGSGWPTT